MSVADVSVAGVSVADVSAAGLGPRSSARPALAAAGVAADATPSALLRDPLLPEARSAAEVSVADVGVAGVGVADVSAAGLGPQSLARSVLPADAEAGTDVSALLRDPLPAGAGPAADVSVADASAATPRAFRAEPAVGAALPATAALRAGAALPAGAASPPRARLRAFVPVGAGAPTSSAAGDCPPDCAGTAPRLRPRAFGFARLRVPAGLLAGARLRRPFPPALDFGLAAFFGGAESVAGARSFALVSARFAGSAVLSAGARPWLFASARPLAPAELREPGSFRIRGRLADWLNPSTLGSASLSPALDCLRAGAADIVSNSSVKAIFVSPVTPTSNSGGSCASRWQACLQVRPAPPRCRPGPRGRSRRTSHQRGFGGSGTERRRKWSYRQHSA